MEPLSYSANDADFESGKMIGTAIYNFQQSIGYSYVADTYEIYDTKAGEVILWPVAASVQLPDRY